MKCDLFSLVYISVEVLLDVYIIMSQFGSCLKFYFFFNLASTQKLISLSLHRYDFFVSKFSCMCGSTSMSENNRAVRQAGLRGLQGVILKTVSDDLQVNIWEDVHIQKIMQALLFNIHEGFINSVQSPSQIR